MTGILEKLRVTPPTPAFVVEIQKRKRTAVFKGKQEGEGHTGGEK